MTCKGCDQYYCYECCEGENWQEFCGNECEKEFLEEEK